MRVLISELDQYPLEYIRDGFTDWIRNNSKIPTPSDIIKYCRDRQRHDRYMAMVYIPPPDPKNDHGYHSLTDEQKKDFDKYMENVKRNLRGRCFNADDNMEE